MAQRTSREVSETGALSAELRGRTDSLTARVFQPPLLRWLAWLHGAALVENRTTSRPSVPIWAGLAVGAFGRLATVCGQDDLGGTVRRFFEDVDPVIVVRSKGT